MIYPSTRMNPQWIQNPITPEVVSWCESFGHFLAPNDDRDNQALTTSQLRRFFGEVKRIQMNQPYSMSDIAMLNPLLAYAVGRDMKNGRPTTRILQFQQEIKVAINAIRPDYIKDDFDNFVNIFEAIVAYHKYYGGRDSKN